MKGVFAGTFCLVRIREGASTALKLTTQNIFPLSVGFRVVRVPVLLTLYDRTADFFKI